MSAPDGTVFASNRAGIQIKGFAQGNLVLNNRISGHAGTALARTGGTGTEHASVASRVTSPTAPSRSRLCLARSTAIGASTVREWWSTISRDTTLAGNDFQDSLSSMTGILVDNGVQNTVIVSRRTGVQDSGSGTMVVAIP